MKRLTALILAAVMLLSLAACGGGGADSKAQEADMIARAEELGKNKSSHEFTSYEHIEQILVVVPKENGGFVDAFEAASDSLEYYSDTSIVNSVEGLVIYCTSSDFSNENKLGSVSYLPVSVQSEDTDEERVRFDTLSMFGAAPVEASDTSALTMIEYNGNKLHFSDGKTGLDGLKWLLAGCSVDFDNWLAAKGETFADVIAAGDAVKDAAGENYAFDADYILYCSKDQQYREYEAYRRQLEYLENAVAALEAIDVADMSEDEVNLAYRKAISAIEEENEFANALQSIYNSRATYISQLRELEPTALAELEALSAEIEEIKKDNEGKDYKDDDRYWKIRLANPNIGQYEDILSSIALLEGSIDTMHALQEETDYSLKRKLEDYSEADMDLYVKYYQSRAAYIAAVMAYEKHLETNAAAIEAFNTAADAIKSKYEGDGYKSDVDYMKLEIQYGSLIQKTEQLEKAVEEAKTESESIQTQREELKEKYETDVAARNRAILCEHDQSKLKKYFVSWKEELLPLKNKGGAGEKSRIVLEKDGFVVIDLSTSIVESVDSGRKVKVSSSGGGGGYSGGGKTCAEPGCTRSPAASGDSVYCPSHSRKCLNCGCYIDKDAMYCMDCLRKALS